jgi:hypothetical protein
LVSSIVGGGSSNFSIAFMAQNQNATLDPLLVFHFNAGFAPRVVDLSLVTCCSTPSGYNCTDRGMAQANEYATDALRLSESTLCQSHRL